MAEAITCPWCDDGKVEVSTKTYYDVTGTIDPDSLRVTISDAKASHVNDRLDGEPFNIESELYCGCSGCGHEFLCDFAAELRARVTRQGTPLNPRTRRDQALQLARHLNAGMTPATALQSIGEDLGGEFENVLNPTNNVIDLGWRGNTHYQVRRAEWFRSGEWLAEIMQRVSDQGRPVP